MGTSSSFADRNGAGGDSTTIDEATEFSRRVVPVKSPSGAFLEVALIAAFFITLLVPLLGCTTTMHAKGEYYQDEGDAGNDPFERGCHYAYSDPCTVNKTFFAQDECLDRVHLVEWTDKTCHGPGPLDKKTYDCNAECIARGHRLSRCTYRDTACPLSPGGLPPAKCFCWDP